jgi:hypothetical protein
MRRARNANLSQRVWRRNFPLVRETLAILETSGFRADVERGSRHFRIKFGKQKLIVSATPGAASAAANNRAMVRRLIRREQQGRS